MTWPKSPRVKLTWWLVVGLSLLPDVGGVMVVLSRAFASRCCTPVRKTGCGGALRARACAPKLRVKVVDVEGAEGEMKSCVLALAGRCDRWCVILSRAVWGAAEL